MLATLHIQAGTQREWDSRYRRYCEESRPHRDSASPYLQVPVRAIDPPRPIAVLKGGANLGKSPAMPSHPRLRDRPEVLDGLVKVIRGFGKRPLDGSAPARPLTPRP